MHMHLNLLQVLASIIDLSLSLLPPHHSIHADSAQALDCDHVFHMDSLKDPGELRPPRRVDTPLRRSARLSRES